VLLRELPELIGRGVRRFRLSPQDVDMVAVARVYRDTLDQRLDADEAMHRLAALTGAVPQINGYMHGREGLAWVGRPG
jgi:collagenase-like PrtC family protease